MRHLVIQVPGMGVAALWLAASLTDRAVTPRDQPDGRKEIASAQTTAPAPNPRGH
jgi:hypothetical protein